MSIEVVKFKKVLHVVEVDRIIEISDISANLFIDMDYSEEGGASIVIAGPEPCVNSIVLEKIGKSLTLSRAKNSRPIFPSVLTITSEGNFYSKAVIRMTIPKGTLVNVFKLDGSIHLNGPIRVNISQ